MEQITRSTLLIQKMVAEAPVVNLLKQWNIVCEQIPFPKTESKDYLLTILLARTERTHIFLVLFLLSLTT